MDRNIVQTRKRTDEIHFRKKCVAGPNETCSEVHRALAEAV